MFPLREAARAGVLSALTDLLPTSSRGQRVAALYAAAGAGQLEALEAILQRLRLSFGLQYAHFLVRFADQAKMPACRGGHLACVQALMRVAPRTALPGPLLWHRSAEAEAAARGEVALLEALVGDQRPDAAHWDVKRVPAVPREDRGLPAAADGYHPLLNAIRGGHLEVVDYLMSRRCVIGVITRSGRDPVEVADALGHAAIAARLREGGATPLDGAARGRLDFSQAVFHGILDRFEALLPETTAQQRGKSLFAAAQQGSAAILYRLAPDASQRQRDFALSHAAQWGELAACRALIGLGASPVDPIGNLEWPPLCWAANRGHDEVVRLLIEAGAKVDRAGRSLGRKTPLRLALQNGHLESFRLLLDAGADPDKGKADLEEMLRESPIGDEARAMLQGAPDRATRRARARDLKARLKRDKRRCFLPELTWGDPGPEASKVGGQPWLTADAPRPVGDAGRPLPLALQLDLRAHPDARSCQDALLQLFYDADAPPPRRGLLRRIPPGGDPLKDGGPALPARGVTGWSRARADYPATPQDPARRGPALEEGAAGLRALGAAGDKLGGWPRWTGPATYPTCPRCEGPQSQLIFQMEGARSLPVDWGHAGVAFLLCCPDHPEAVGFLAQSG